MSSTKQIENNNSSTMTNTNNINNNDSKMPIKRLPYDIKIFSFLCILGLLIKVIFGNASKDYATATIYGYSFSLFALMCLVVSSFAITQKQQFNQTTLSFLKNVIGGCVPLILVASIICLIVYQNIAFYNQINDGKVPDEYYQYSGISSFLIIIPVCLVIQYLIDVYKGSTHNKNSEMMTILSSEIYNIIMILCVINLFFVGILQIILKYFSTDG